MSPIGSVGSALNALSLSRVDPPLLKPLTGPTQPSDTRPATAADSFGHMLDGLAATVDAKEAQAGEITRQVLLGDSGQLHQSVVAMQEASVAFSLMIEVRNKLVESYQELMHMQV
jgi:flagellar hook-basal body complex protein FliE